MKCPTCQFDNPSDSKFCKECGTRIGTPPRAPFTQTLEIPKDDLAPGAVFAERYQIVEELGGGGMGNVFRAVDKKLNEEVALKLIRPEIALDKATLERFHNELKVARKISQRHVGRMYELMEANGRHFITMEYVAGQDLRALTRQTGRLTISKAVSIAVEVCEGLAEAHRLGVIHRDLKPSNIIIDKQGNARIMDFGIARSIHGKSLTGEGIIIGTPEYMSPEQVEGKDVDQRSDIYSLGIILFEMVTGRVPFEGDTPFTIGVKHKSEKPQNPKILNPQIPDDLGRLILKCLAKDREARYPSAEALRLDLQKIEKTLPSTDSTPTRKRPLTSRTITVDFQVKKAIIPALGLVVLILAAWALLKLVPR
jgi:serine/threonine protein kinase